MSLINDALKRAKQAQQNRPPTPAPVPPLRPAEPATRRPASNSNLAVPAAVLIVIALAAVLVWQSSRKGEVQPGAPATAPVAPPPATVVAKTEPAAPAPA